MNLGDRILDCRQNMKITQEELASRLGVTPQAVSKWERNQSFPDILIFAQLCRILNVSADLLLETECGNLSESSDIAINAEIRKILRDSEEPFVLEIGEGFVDVFTKHLDVKYIDRQRKKLAGIGMLMPVLHIRDNLALKPNEFMIQSYHRVLYSEEVKVIDEHTFEYIAEKTGAVAREKYDYILNKDIVRILVENLKTEYPAVADHVVPEVISYSLLQKVLIGLLKRGDGLCYMIKTLEVLEDELRKNPQAEPDALVCAVAKEIEREDNYYVLMHKRKGRGAEISVYDK